MHPSASAIEHIEQITGLTCIPPVSLAVDEWAIQQIKSSEPVANLDELATNLWAIGTLVSALALGLHVGLEVKDSKQRFRPEFGSTGDCRDIFYRLAEGFVGYITEIVLEWGGFSARDKYGRWVGPPRPIVQHEGIQEERHQSEAYNPVFDFEKPCPSWRRKLNDMAHCVAIDEPEPVGSGTLLRALLERFIIGYREAVESLGGDAVYRCGFAIDHFAVERSQGFIDFKNIHFSERKAWLSEDRIELELEGLVSEVGEVFGSLSETYIRIFDSFHALIQGNSSQVANARTYAVYLDGTKENDRALADWAVDRDLRSELTLQGTPKILLCVEALSRREADIGVEAVKQGLRRSLLIHEHFHAAIAANMGTDPILREDINKLRTIEESLAVWLEFEAARNYPELEKLVRDYAANGKYPDWPYAGAFVIEEMYRQGGLPAVRLLIERFLKKPAEAENRFNRIADIFNKNRE